ncbi:MAG: hypothetical protein AAFQ04_12665 [Pseudomonadota bacterium]
MPKIPNRTMLAQGIKDLINAHGPTRVTITMDASDANQLADDLLWCTRSTGRHYHAERITGDIKERDGG